MKKIIFLIILLAIDMPSFASNWVQFGEKTYVDTESIELYKTEYGDIKFGKYSFWIKDLNDKSTRFNDLEKLLKKKIWYKMENYIMDCNAKNMAMNQVIIYGLQNDVLDSYNHIYLNYEKIVPDSNGEVWYYLICKPKQFKKKYLEN